MDTESKKFLEEVKKGKARKFVMICKGVKILSMFVYKKGTVEKYKKQAKQEGKGQFYHGVVNGKGLEIAFNLSSSDGFDKPPGKELILKDFLKTEADMKFKPSYQIVTDLPEVDESDDDVDSTGDTSPAESDSTATDSSLADQFKVRLTALVARLKAAAGTPAGGEAKLKASEANVFARKEDFVQANALLDQADDLLNSASDTTSSSSETDTSLADQFKVRLTALVAQLKAAAGTSAGGEAKLKASEANVFARKADFVQANALLDQADDLLNSAANSVTDSELDSATETATDVLAVWRDAKESVDDQLNKLSAELRNSSHPYLQEIGGVGLHELAKDQGGIYVSMQASLFEFNGSDGVGRQKAAAKVLDAVNNYRSFVETSEVLKVVDQHKNTTLVSSLRDALNKLENEMQRHAA